MSSQLAELGRRLQQQAQARVRARDQREKRDDQVRELSRRELGRDLRGQLGHRDLRDPLQPLAVLALVGFARLRGVSEGAPSALAPDLAASARGFAIS